MTNPAAYDAALCQRGSLTLRSTDAAIAAWKAEPRTTRGGQQCCFALAISTALTLRAVFQLALAAGEAWHEDALSRSSAVPSDTAGTAPTQHDRHLQTISGHGRRSWQKASGYRWRALVEADISRFKRVIGGELRSRTDHRNKTEIALAVSILNRMLELGRPKYVRLA